MSGPGPSLGKWSGCITRHGGAPSRVPAEIEFACFARAVHEAITVLDIFGEDLHRKEALWTDAHPERGA